MPTLSSSVTIGGQPLRPAPYVSTSYEYNKSGDYVISGFLIVTLSGSIIGKDIVNQITALNGLVGKNCISLVVGCQGGSDFLNGNGRVRSVDISRSDQPFVSQYTITVALETVDGQQAVKADPEFLRSNCLTTADYILSYNEEITLEGGDQIGDTGTFVSTSITKSYVKARGRISITPFARDICGVPSYNGNAQAISILNDRYSALTSMTPCTTGVNPLSKYSGWSKWIDTKNIEIGSNGVSCTFDLYMSRGTCNPMAWTEVTYEGSTDLITQIKRGTVSGTIRGLSTQTMGLVSDKTMANERLTNAITVFNKLKNDIINTPYGAEITIIGVIGICKNDPCDLSNVPKPLCRQIISSTVTTSVVSGEITFSFEVEDIENCPDSKKDGRIYTLESTVDEKMYGMRHQEFIIPNRKNSVIQLLGDEPREVTINTRGTITSCETKYLPTLKACVITNHNTQTRPYNGWLQKSKSTREGTLSYEITEVRVSCR
jgi:hypothetical protein